MRKEKTKERRKAIISKQKGITLIALVITIIVLLILAGVAIAALTGENGLLTKASEAQEKTSIANDEERIEVEVLGSYGKNGKLDLSNLKDNIKKNIPEATVEGENFPIKVKIGKNLYVVTGEGEVTAKQYTERKGIKVGDYIDYTPGEADAYPVEKLGQEYTGSTSNGEDGLEQETGLNWRILSIDEYGDMDLISEPTSKTVYFSGARGYNNGVYVMNDICEKLYSKEDKGIKARSVNLEDMEKYLTDAGKKAKADYISNQVNNLSSNSYIESVNKGNNEVTYKKERSYYPLLWKVQNNESENYYTEDTLIKNDGKGSSYDQEENLTVTQTYYYIPINEENYGDGYTVLSTGNAYWVASRFVNTDSSIAGFGLRYAYTYMGGNRMFLSSNSTYSFSARLRAVVSLGSDIQVTPAEGVNSSTNKHKINWK